MDSLLHIGLSNAVVATGLALLAAVVGWLGRRPALTHGLWLLVLLKLITPPLHSVEITWPAAEKPTAVGVPAAPEAEEHSTVAETADALASTPDLGIVFLRNDLPVETETATVPYASPAPTPAADESPAPVGGNAGLAWQPVIAGIWLAGAGLWFLVAIWRIHQFRRLLRFAEPATADLQELVRRLADHVGLKKAPGVWTVPGSVSPMLWAIAGRPRLLVPSALWQRLSEEQRATLLAHELAHLRRRDHWVRRLEFVATGLFWWHPVVWWARREIRIAEEECCDAWVVWALPAAVRDYALALMETVDFLSEVRTALPPAVSGVGHVQLLRRRLAMIMLGTNSRALSSAGFVGLVLLGALVLPLLPTWAQEPRTKDEPQKLVPANDQIQEERQIIVLQRDDSTPGQIRLHVVGGKDGAAKTPTAGLDEARDEVELLQAQLDVKRAELAEGEARVKQAVQRWERIKQLWQKGAISEGEWAKMQDDVELAKAQLEPKRAQVREAEIRLHQAQRRIAQLHQAGTPIMNKVRVIQPPPIALTPSKKATKPEQEQRRAEELLKQLLESKEGVSDEMKARIVQELRLRRQAQAEAEKARAEAEKAKADAAKAYQDAIQLREKLKAADQYRSFGESLQKKLADDALDQARSGLAGQKPKGGQGGKTGTTSSDSQLQDLQKKVEALTREMEELRKDLKKLTSPKPIPAPLERKKIERKEVPMSPLPRYELVPQEYQSVPAPGGKGIEYKLVPRPRPDPRSTPTVPLSPAETPNSPK